MDFFVRLGAVLEANEMMLNLLGEIETSKGNFRAIFNEAFIGIKTGSSIYCLESEARILFWRPYY